MHLSCTSSSSGSDMRYLIYSLQIPLHSRYYYLHFADVETEAKKLIQSHREKAREGVRERERAERHT